MPRKKKDSFDKAIDSFFKRLDNIIDKLTVRDIIWLMTWASIVYAAYIIIEDIKDIEEEGWFDTPYGFIAWVFSTGFRLGWMRFNNQEPPEPTPEDQKVNWMSLATAMGSAWIIMNTTVDDIKDAIGSVTQLLKKKLI